MARLSDAQWQECRTEWVAGKLAVKFLARHYGVSPAAIRDRARAHEWPGRGDVEKLPPASKLPPKTSPLDEPGAKASQVRTVRATRVENFPPVVGEVSLSLAAFDVSSGVELSAFIATQRLLETIYEAYPEARATLAWAHDTIASLDRWKAKKAEFGGELSLGEIDMVNRIQSSVSDELRKRRSWLLKLLGWDEKERLPNQTDMIQLMGPDALQRFMAALEALMSDGGEGAA